MTLGIFLAILALGLILGSVNVLIATALDEMSPLLIQTVRAVNGTAILLVIVAAARINFLPALRRHFWALLVIAVTNYVGPWLLITWGQTHTHSGTAGVLAATSPVFTALLAGALLPNEPLRARILIALLIGLAGVGLIAGVDLGSLGVMNFVGDMAIVFAALSFAIAAIIIRKIMGEYHVLAIVTSMALLSVAILVPASAIFHRPGDLAVSGQTWMALILLGSFSGLGISLPLYFWLIGRAGPVRTSFLFYIAPAVAVLFGWAFRSEDLSLQIIGGLALIVISLALANDLPALFRRRAPRAPAEAEAQLQAKL